jgi:hypothetical protein
MLGVSKPARNYTHNPAGQEKTPGLKKFVYLVLSGIYNPVYKCRQL